MSPPVIAPAAAPVPNGGAPPANCAAGVRGAQGVGPFWDRTHIVATIGHVPARGLTGTGTSSTRPDASEGGHREALLVRFLEALHEGGVPSLMVPYDGIDWPIDRTFGIGSGAVDLLVGSSSWDTSPEAGPRRVTL